MTTSQNHRYREIANQLLAEIRKGTFAVGERIPTEHAVSQDFGVSRNTARHAVQELERLGLVSRQRGAGTVVIRTDPRPAFVSSITSIDDLLQYAATARIVIRRRRAALALPAMEGVALPRQAGDWIHLEGLRFLSDRDGPICSTDIFLHPEVADVAPMIGHQTLPVYRLIENHHNLLIHSIVQIIEGVTLAADTADELEVKEGSAGLKVTRAYNDISGRTVELAVNIYPAGSFAYRMTILRNTQPEQLP